MPLVYQQNINLNTRLAVWHISEPPAFFENLSLNAEYINHPHKRLQTMAGRNLLRELDPGFPLHLIKIADTKKPFLPGDPFHFSISHCQDYAAAIISTENRVGVDVEIPQQKIMLLRQKFLSQTEMEVLEKTELEFTVALTIAWCIKECMFKWYGAGKVNFKEHMHLLELTTEGNAFTADCLFLKDEPRSLHVRGLLINSFCLAWVVS